MALILMCGLPASGKSIVAGRLCSLLKEEGGEVQVITDGEDFIGASHAKREASAAELAADALRASLYKDSTAEKKTRARLRAATERALNGSRVVICDSLNYIKGFRYEMYCVAKTSGTRYCVVHCEQDPDQAVKLDQERKDRGEDSYGADLCTALTRRFEAPIERNRWDSPLHRVNVFQEGWESGLDSVRDLALRRGSKLTPTMATRMPEKQGADVFGTLDRLSREAEAAITAELQQGKGKGEKILVPGATEPVRLERKPKVAELRNMRRAYLNLARMHPPQGKSHGELVDEYVKFINNQLRVIR